MTETGTIDRLYLELSQFTKATTAKELALADALRPFAKVYDLDISLDEDETDLFQVMRENNRAPKLTVGDFRRAFEALLEAEGRS